MPLANIKWRPGNGWEVGPPKRSTICQRGRSLMARWLAAPLPPRFDWPLQEARFAVLPTQDEVSAHPTMFGGAGTELRPRITCLRSATSVGLPILYGRGKELGAGEELLLFPSTPPFMASVGEE